MSPLVARLHALASGGVLEVLPGEYPVNLVLDRPLTLRGRGIVTHLQGAPGSGPTLHVTSPGVSLEDIALEHLDRRGVALMVEPGMDPRIERVSIVAGAVRGIVLPGGHPASIPVSSERPSRPGPRITRRVEQMLDAAEASELRGDLPGAIELYDRVLVLVPGHADAAGLRALAERLLASNDLSSTRTSSPTSTATSSARSTSSPFSTPSEQGNAEMRPLSRWTVDANGAGDCLEIADAVAMAPRGAVITVRAGTYRKPVFLDRELEIVAESGSTSVVLDVVGDTAIRSTAERALVRGLTLRQGGKRRKHEARGCTVDTSTGSLHLVECDISGSGEAVVSVRGNAAPTLRDCQIHHGRDVGLLLQDSATGLIERCAIFGHGAACVELRHRASPTLRECEIHAGRATGIVALAMASGLLESCDIHDHVEVCVDIRTRETLTLRGCRIRAGRAGGVLVSDGGTGWLERCDIQGNTGAGLEIREHASPVIRACRIREGRASGVSVHSEGGGVLEACTIEGNALAGIAVRTHAALTVRSCVIQRNGYEGIWVYEDGGGVFEDNDLRGNDRGAWDVDPGCEPRIAGRRNRT